MNFSGPSGGTYNTSRDYVSSPCTSFSRIYPDLHSTKCQELPEDFDRMKRQLSCDPDSLERVHYQVVPCTPGPAMIASVTPLQNAVEKLHVECVNFLLKAGAVVEKEEYARRPLLLLAMQVWNHKKSREIVDLLINKNISANYLYNKFQNGATTYLNFAISINFVDMVEILLNHGAITEDFSILNSTEPNNYITPIYQAFQREKPETCKLLFLHGATMNPHKFKPNIELSNIYESILHLFVDRIYFLPPNSRELNVMEEMLNLYYDFGGNMRLKKNGKTALEHMKTNFPSNENWYGFDVILERLTTRPLSLQRLCRLTIRNSMGKSCWDNIHNLPLPHDILNYLRFS